MKKFLSIALITAALCSCDKKETVAETDFSSENITVPETNEPAPVFKSVEYSAQQLSDLLATKQNDTVYVTNFFATWCGPCMREIPHFKEKMTELHNQPVKFTFVSLDDKEDWPTKVKDFAETQRLTKNVILLDAENLQPDFFSKNFGEWDGSSIPYTHIRKGSQVDETIGMMTKSELDRKMANFISSDATNSSQTLTDSTKTATRVD